MDKNFNIKDVIPAELSEYLTEESLATIKENIENLVEARVAERIDIAIKSNQDELDEAISKDVNLLIDQITECHTRKASRAMTTLKKRCNEKVRLVREYYQKKVDKDSKRFKENLVESINKYIDRNMKKHLPISMIREAVRNNSALKLIGSLKNILSVNEASMKKSIKKGILEANEKIKTLTNDNQILATGYKQLQENTKVLEAKNFLNEKCQGLSESVKNRVMRALDGQSLEYIKENFDYAVKCVKKNEEKAREQLKESTIKERIKKTSKQPTRKNLLESRKIEESVDSHEDYMRNILDSVDDI